MLYLVPTPIGNMQDMTYRAVKVLQEADLILAEDTRTSGHILKEYRIDTPTKSFHAFNEHKTVSTFIAALVKGDNIALISDAGTPGISDPGFLLVREAIAEGIEITCLPGPTAIIPAVVMSGLPCDKFYFEGFLPHKKGRKTRWEFLSILPCTVVLYESPHRIVKCLKEIVEHCGSDRLVSVSREISKKFEENIRGTASEVLEKISNDTIKGEIVVCVKGWSD